MSDDNIRANNLNSAEVNQIACEILDQTAKPEDARRLLSQFCDLYDWGIYNFQGDQTRQFQLLLRYIQDSLRNYLNGNRKTLEAALGLKMKKARPNADPNRRMQMAKEVLRFRLQNQSHQDALAKVAEKFNCGETIVGVAWKKYKQDGLILLSQERKEASDTYPWTPEEVKKLTKIYKKLNEQIKSLLR